MTYVPKVWFTADLHLKHPNIIKYCQRPFMNDAELAAVIAARRSSGDVWRSPEFEEIKISAETVERHDTHLIDQINRLVNARDILWNLGDFAMCNLTKAKALRERINCRNIFFVRGNHDRKSYDVLFRRAFDQVLTHVGDVPIFLNHYAMRVWPQSHRGSLHLYGHSHGMLESIAWTKSMDVGVDCHNYSPVSFEEVYDQLCKGTKKHAKTV